MAEAKSLTMSEVVANAVNGEGFDFLREAVEVVCQEIMDAEVTRTLSMDGGGNTVNFSKIGDHQGRETIHYRIRFTDFKLAIRI